MSMGQIRWKHKVPVPDLLDPPGNKAPLPNKMKVPYEKQTNNRILKKCTSLKTLFIKGKAWNLVKYSDFKNQITHL